MGLSSGETRIKLSQSHRLKYYRAMNSKHHSLAASHKQRCHSTKGVSPSREIQDQAKLLSVIDLGETPGWGAFWNAAWCHAYAYSASEACVSETGLPQLYWSLSVHRVLGGGHLAGEVGWCLK